MPEGFTRCQCKSKRDGSKQRHTPVSAQLSSTVRKIRLSLWLDSELSRFSPTPSIVSLDLAPTPISLAARRPLSASQRLGPAIMLTVLWIDRDEAAFVGSVNCAKILIEAGRQRTFTI